MEWKNGEITKVVIKSSLGGTCRIRSYSKLKADGKSILKSAKGVNKNPFYQTPKIKQPLVSPKAKLKKINLKNTFIYDVETQPGEKYIFSGI